DQLDGLHQSHAAHVTNQLVFALQIFETIAEVAADGCGIVHQAVFFDQIDGGFGSNRGYRITAEGGDLQPFEAGRDFGTRECSADGSSVGQALGRRDDIGRDLPVLDAEPALASATPSSLDFVGDKETAVVLDDLEDDLEVFLWRRNESTHALDRFGD